MKTLFYFSLGALVLGILGVSINVYTGLSLTRNLASESDFHLTIALTSVAVLILASLGLIRTSRKNVEQLQEKLLFVSKVEPLQRISESRNQAVSYSIFLIVCCVINLISGTISQAGRFPLVHGLFGFILFALTLTTFIFWIRFTIHLIKLNN